MNSVAEEVFHGYNNHFDLKNKFYDFLTKELRNEIDKIEFLKETILNIESKYLVHQQKCKLSDDECGKFLMKEAAIKIINSKIKEIENDNRVDQIINIDNSSNKNVVSDSIGVIINQNSNNHINSDTKENWFKKNIKFIYYTLAVIGICYSFYKWILPLF